MKAVLLLLALAPGHKEPAYNRVPVTDLAACLKHLDTPASLPQVAKLPVETHVLTASCAPLPAAAPR